MKKTGAFMLFLLVVVLTSSSVSALQGADFAVYVGGGAWEHSITAFENFLEWKGYTYEEVTKQDVNNNDLRPLYDGIFFPGGWAWNYKKDINSAGRQHIRDLVSNGGAYIGMSAGAYFACDTVVWEEDSINYPLDLFAGDCIGPIDEIASWPNYVMTTMTINLEHEANAYETATEDILYYGEPYFVADAGQEMQTFALWIVSSNPAVNNQPGIIGFNYGNGRVLLVGPHPEIEEDNNRDGTAFADELNDNGSDWPFLWTAIDWLMQQPISQPPELPDGSQQPLSQCSDGNDNDGDGLIDWPNDLGCVNSEDNDETDIISGDIFFDDFESGSLNGWITSAVSGSNIWVNTDTNPFLGVRHAQSKPQSTAEPASILERPVSTAGFSNIEFSYSRKLVGLDTADEFKAKWFDGAMWQTLEQTGGNSANDAAYVFRSFNLPLSADNNLNLRIRFECTAGAVSEFCRVDDVSVRAL